MSVQQQQLINLFILLLLGSFFSNIYLSWWEMGIILSFTALFEYFTRVDKLSSFYISFSSLSTAIGVMLMMVSTSLYTYCIVIALALSQKHYLQINKHHFFNPSNFALIMALLLFYDDAHIVLGQLGDDFWLLLTLLLMAILILFRINRWIIPLSFVLFYLLFQYIFVVSLDPVLIMEEIYHRFYAISFILFIFFMLTDPKTTPSKISAQLLFAFFMALSTVLLDYFYGFRVQHLFLSLFFFSLFTPLVEGWQERSKNMILVTLLLATLVIVVIIIIESKSPFYFTMDG